MASLSQFRQTYVDLRNGTGKVLGIHELTLKSSSDTITVPDLDNSTNDSSSAILLQNGQSGITVSDDGTRTVTISSGSEGDEVVVVTIHKALRNFSDEA